jgi:hypothetical protein
MSSDLEGSLVEGGLAPAAAKVIANAIANLASQQLSLGRQFQDATPAKQMRLVTADTRRYVLTNLDHSNEEPFARSLDRTKGQYQPRDVRHPYQDSQPATASGTISTPAVREGDYISVVASSKDSVRQATVSLRINQIGGRHTRLNTSTKTVEVVPFSTEVAQEQFVEASFEERPNGTVLKITLKNLRQYTLPNGNKFWGWEAS